MDSIGCSLASISLDANDKHDSSLTCTAPDCPLHDTKHSKGLYLHDAALESGVRFHHDFGYSNPPPFLWAAYFRYTQNFKELEDDYCRSNGRVDKHGHHPFERPGPDDRPMLLNFLRYHAVTLRQKGPHLEEIPLRGKILSCEEPSMVADMDALTL